MRKLNKQDNKNVKFVLKFNKIKLSRLCEKLNLPRTSINSGKGKIEDYEKLKEEIESEIAKLYIKE